MEAARWPPICVAAPWCPLSDVHDGQCRATKSIWQPSTDLRDSLMVATIPAWRLPWVAGYVWQPLQWPPWWLLICLAATDLDGGLFISCRSVATNLHGGLFMFGSHCDGCGHHVWWLHGGRQICLAVFTWVPAATCAG
jgi:hypothetical protein